MNKDEIIRAWKNPDYRNALDETEAHLLPQHPAGAVGLTDSELSEVYGGQDMMELELKTREVATWGCCSRFDICADSYGMPCTHSVLTFGCC